MKAIDRLDDDKKAYKINFLNLFFVSFLHWSAIRVGFFVLVNNNRSKDYKSSILVSFLH